MIVSLASRFFDSEFSLGGGQSFVRLLHNTADMGSHGPKFVTKLLSTVSLSDPKLEDLRGFVDKVHKGAHGILTDAASEKVVADSEVCA